MDHINYLEQELKMMLENIVRVKKFVNDKSSDRWTPTTSLVVGELKHRAVVMRQRLTLVSKISTGDLFK